MIDPRYIQEPSMRSPRPDTLDRLTTSRRDEFVSPSRRRAGHAPGVKLTASRLGLSAASHASSVLRPRSTSLRCTSARLFISCSLTPLGDQFVDQRGTWLHVLADQALGALQSAASTL
jgi:hypothetical protein